MNVYLPSPLQILGNPQRSNSHDAIIHADIDKPLLPATSKNTQGSSGITDDEGE